MAKSTPYIDEFPGVETDEDLLELAAKELDGRAGKIAEVALSAKPGDDDE